MGRAKPGQEEQQPQTLSLRLAQERLLAGPRGARAGKLRGTCSVRSFAVPALPGMSGIRGFFLDVVPDLLSSQLLEVLLSGSGPVCTPGDASDPHRGGVMVGSGASGGGGGSNQSGSHLQGRFLSASSRIWDSRVPWLVAASLSLCLCPHTATHPQVCPVASGGALDLQLTWIPQRGLISRRFGGGLHLQTPPSDSIPSWLPASVCFRERCSSHHRASFYFPANIQVTGAGVGSQLGALTPKLATWPGGAPESSREGTWQDAPAKRAAGKVRLCTQMT